MDDHDTVESRQGTRLAGYRANPEWERRLLPPEEQDLLNIAEQLEKRVFETVNLEGEYVEKREAAMEWGDGLVTGHPDLIRIYTGLDVSVIIDDKFGWHPVPPADVNLQLRCYAIMAPTETVYVAISQPRLAVADRLTIAQYTTKSKAAAREQIVAILRASEDPEAPLIAGEEQCRFCRARAICPALREVVTKQLAGFEDLAPEFAPELSRGKVLAVVEARLAQASDTQLGALFNACALARLVNDPMGEEIRRRITAGSMEGWKLAKESEVRNISDAPLAISLLVLGRILPREQILRICDLPIGKIERAHRQRNKVTAKQATEEINRLLASVIEIEKRKQKILPPK